ncbi:MAG TPA: sensory rhodopsin transducer [Stellaceae bacterium]|nr:sensory rhodopsin transducer [Stellaceae bacterium]
MADTVGKRLWAIPEGYIPGHSTGSGAALLSHEAACILNAGERDAHIEIMLYFTDQEPVGPYHATVPARRTAHLRFNDLREPRPVPRDTPYASLISSDVPIVVQHTRLDSRQAELALLSTIAFPVE